MANEGAVDKRQFSMRLPIETIKKAEHKYGQEEDVSFRESIVRAIEDATREVALTPQEYREIAEETENNIRMRMEKRGDK